MDGVLWCFSQPIGSCRSDRPEAWSPGLCLGAGVLLALGLCPATTGQSYRNLWLNHSNWNSAGVGAGLRQHRVLAACIGLGWLPLKPGLLLGKRDACSGLSDTGTSVCSAAFPSPRLASVWVSAKTLDLTFVCSSSLPRDLPEAASLMQIPAPLTLNTGNHSEGSAELHPVEAQNVLCGVMSPMGVGGTFHSCLSPVGERFCLLQYNTIGFVAFVQVA